MSLQTTERARAAPVVVICALVEDAAVEGAMEYAAAVLHSAFHLVEHHPLQHQAAVAVACLKPMSLLQKVVPPQPGEEHCVQINLRAHVMPRAMRRWALHRHILR